MRLAPSGNPPVTTTSFAAASATPSEVQNSTSLTAQFIAAVKEHSPAILGMSALLTTTLPHMGETIQALKDEGLRESVKVMVGGAPVTQAWADEVGADGYGANAGMAVERAKGLVGT